MAPTILSDADIEAIERATLDAVSPERVESLPGWLLPMDSGTVGRARSAVPLSHGNADPAVLAEVRDAVKESIETQLAALRKVQAKDPQRGLVGSLVGGVQSLLASAPAMAAKW